MKAIICFANGDVHIHSFTSEWTICSCGNVKAKWLDAKSGTVVVAAHDKRRVRLLGMNNAYLVPALQLSHIEWPDYRVLHDKATEAPGYLFDKDKINCWAAIVEIGRSNDVRWANPDEFNEAFKEK